MAACAAALLYLGTARFDFAYDDPIVVAGHPQVTAHAWGAIFTSPYHVGEHVRVQTGAYRPLTIASFAATHAAVGLRPRGYHLVNILLHALAAALVVALAAELGLTAGGSLAGGLAFADFRGYEDWPVVASSQSANLKLVAVILANPEMIEAYKAGIPGNGKPFPDGAKMAKIHWNAKVDASEPGAPTVPGTQHDVDFMLKDSKRFADSGGWGYGAFEYEAASGKFRLANLTDKPPQGNDAKCGFTCHTSVKNKDYVFTDYGRR